MRLLMCLLFTSILMNAQEKRSCMEIDFSKAYSEKTLSLQSLAEVEYVPLETSDEVLLGQMPKLAAVTNNYIVLFEWRSGNIFIFTRKGKIVSHFNHRGNGPQEYNRISSLVFDETNEEIFISDLNKVYVFSLQGTYKRSFSLPAEHEYVLFQYTNDRLILYEKPALALQSDPKETKPYQVISKRDGSRTAELNIAVKNRLSDRMVIPVEGGFTSASFRVPQNMYFGKQTMIAEITSDTIYQMSQAGDLHPIITRKPSVHTTNPHQVWGISLTTSKFILLETVVLDVKNSQDAQWMINCHSGQIEKVQIKDAEFLTEQRTPKKWVPKESPLIEQNQMAELIPAADMLDSSERKLLKGNGMEVAKSLQEDDNQVVRILTFK